MHVFFPNMANINKIFNERVLDVFTFLFTLQRQSLKVLLRVYNMSEINMILSDIETISDNDSFEVLNEQDLLALKRNKAKS